MQNYTASRYLPIAWELIHRDTRQLANRLVDMGPFKGIIAITRGGLIPSSILARELDIRVIESISIASYADDNTQGAPQILKDVNRDLVGDGNGWLIVDDLVDSGVTARLVKGLFPKAFLVTVYAKPQGQSVVDLFAVPIDDIWLLFPWDGELQPNEPLAYRR